MHSQRKTLARRCVLTWAIGMAVLTALWAAGAPAAVMLAWTGAYAVLALAAR